MRGFFVGVGAAVLGACGGNVVVDPSPTTAATGGSGGAGSTSTASTGTTVTSSSATTTSSSSGCPTPFPGLEAACGAPGQTCLVPGSCCGGSAVCENGFWSYLPPPACEQPCTLECGPDGFQCEGGLVCVTYIGETTVYQCDANPCMGALDCSCAASLCATDSMTCNNIQMGFKVLCD